MKAKSINRIRLFSIFIILFALLLVVRLYLVQIVSGETYAQKADRQYIKSSYNYYDRGTVYFKTKDGELVPAATLRTGYILAINPGQLKDDQGTYEALSKYVEIDKLIFLAKASIKADPYEEIEDRLPADIAKKIADLKLPGVSLIEQRWRYYPGNNMAAHTLGFIAYKDDELAGRYGLERYYDSVLNRNNDSVFVNFFAEIFSNLQDRISSSKEPEGDIVTTIEPTVEAYLEEELKKISQKWNSDYSGGIVMDPKSGEIFAMAIDPTFDLNNFKDAAGLEIFQNHLVDSVYEMGSIIKPLTMAAGLDTGVVTPSTTYFDTGSITVNGKTISNYDGRARGLVDIQQVLNQSLNVGAAFVERQIGNKQFAEYMDKYKIGEETGIDLPNEVHGLTENLNSPRDVEYATASFGQGIAMTPIATIRALASLANGGVLPSPHLVSRINYSLGDSKKVIPNPGPRAIDEETSEEITRMLVKVVDEALLEGKAKDPNYSVAAKTGTAQVANPDGGGYYSDVYLHSFFGYFPAYQPRFIVFLFTYNPKGVKYASETLTTSFLDLTKFLINYYNVPPDRGAAG